VEVYSTLKSGMSRVVIPWYTMENTPLMMAWEAMMVAMMVRIRNGM
jgi:hypothetical protein